MWALQPLIFFSENFFMAPKASLSFVALPARFPRIGAQSSRPPSCRLWPTVPLIPGIGGVKLVIRQPSTT